MAIGGLIDLPAVGRLVGWLVELKIQNSLFAVD
jgi:hypothetical protein